MAFLLTLHDCFLGCLLGGSVGRLFGVVVVAFVVDAFDVDDDVAAVVDAVVVTVTDLPLLLLLWL